MPVLRPLLVLGRAHPAVQQRAETVATQFSHLQSHYADKDLIAVKTESDANTLLKAANLTNVPVKEVVDFESQKKWYTFEANSQVLQSPLKYVIDQSSKLVMVNSEDILLQFINGGHRRVPRHTLNDESLLRAFDDEVLKTKRDLFFNQGPSMSSDR